MHGEHYAGIRRLGSGLPRCLRLPGCAGRVALMRALDMLHEMNRRALPSLPKSAPIGFIQQFWARHVLGGGSIYRGYNELCVLSECVTICAPATVWGRRRRRYRGSRSVCRPPALYSGGSSSPGGPTG